MERYEYDVSDDISIKYRHLILSIKGEMNMNESGDNKLSKSSLIGLVIGSMIGGGAFNIMSDMGGKAGGLAIIIGWIIITAIGMISLAFVISKFNQWTAGARRWYL